MTDKQDKPTKFTFRIPDRLKTRRSTANVLMFSFIIMTSIGGFLISPAVGFIIAGATSGIFGFLLGLE